MSAEEGGGGHGGSWIVTYSDMITLLMTLFIVIVTFGTKQQDKYSKKNDSIVGGKGGVGAAGPSTQGADRTSVLMRVSPLGRPVINGSEVPPLYSDPSTKTIESALNGFTETPPGRLSDNYRLRIPINFLFLDDQKLTDSGMRALMTLAGAVQHLPYDIRLQVNDPSRLPQAARVMEFLFQIAGIHPGRIGVGVDTVHRQREGYIWLSLVETAEVPPMFLFRKKKKGHGSGYDANAWMMSYADMATILLAMFIVLSTFSQDQTGISLYHGTGSFKNAMKSFGLPGLMPNSARTIDLNFPGPQHAFEPPEEWKKNPGRDPNEPARTIDAEEEYFQHFLAEIGRAFPLTKTSRLSGRVTLDMFDPLAKEPPYITDKHRPTILPQLAMLRHKNYEVQIVVWAGMPAQTALVRSSEQANVIVQTLADGAELTPDERTRLIGIGQSWRFRDVRRPVISVMITKTQ